MPGHAFFSIACVSQGGESNFDNLMKKYSDGFECDLFVLVSNGFGSVLLYMTKYVMIQ